MRILRGGWALGLTLCFLIPTAAAAQAVSVERGAFPEQGNLWASYGLATGIGAAGFVAGFIAAADASGGDCEDLSCLEAGFYGGALLGTFGVALGAHLGNRRRGNLGLDFATAAGIWGLGIGPLLLGGDTGGDGAAILFVAVPIAQVLVTAAVDRSVGRKREREHNGSLGLSVLPTTDGGIALLGQISP
ncbi:MAG: hypothetical protein ABFS14_04455 [Gemmatimonadota bacterium]